MRPRASGLIVGWREFVELPDLGVTVKAKVDTGARTSALHVADIVHDGDEVEFTVFPNQHDQDDSRRVRTALVDVRDVRPSSGESQERLVIATSAKLHGRRWRIELTLASRDDMRFRMLLGRTAVRGRFLVDPAVSFLAGRP